MAKKPLKERLQKLAGISKFKSLINEQSNPDIINWVNQLYASNVGTGIAEGCSYAAIVQSTAVVSDESYYEECQYSTDTNLIDNSITCLNGGRHVVTKACMPDENGLMPDGGSPSNNIQGQLETGNYINDPILGNVANPTYYNYCTFVDGETPNGSHIGRIITNSECGQTRIIVAIGLQVTNTQANDPNYGPNANPSNYVLCQDQIDCSACGAPGCADEGETYGCTDINALNYNEAATLDDGSCEYEGDDPDDPIFESCDDINEWLTAQDFSTTPNGEPNNYYNLGLENTFEDFCMMCENTGGDMNNDGVVDTGEAANSWYTLYSDQCDCCNEGGEDPDPDDPDPDGPDTPEVNCQNFTQEIQNNSPELEDGGLDDIDAFCTACTNEPEILAGLTQESTGIPYTDYCQCCEGGGDDPDPDGPVIEGCEEFEAIIASGQATAEEICGTPGGGIQGTYYDIVANPGDYPITISEPITLITQDGVCCPEGPIDPDNEDCTLLTELPGQQQLALCNAYYNDTNNPAWQNPALSVYNLETCCSDLPEFQKHACLVDGCTPDPQGQFNSLAECQASGCVPQYDCDSPEAENVFNVFGGIDVFCSEACVSAGSSSQICACCPDDPTPDEPNCENLTDEWVDVNFNDAANVGFNVEEYCLWCDGTIGQFLQGGSDELCPCCDEGGGDDPVFTGCDDLDLDAFAQSLGFMEGSPKFCNECSTNSDFASQYSDECGCCEDVGGEDDVRYDCTQTGCQQVPAPYGAFDSLEECEASGCGGVEDACEEDGNNYYMSLTPLARNQCCHQIIYGQFWQMNPPYTQGNYPNDWPPVAGNPCTGISLECCQQQGVDAVGPSDPIKGGQPTVNTPGAPQPKDYRGGATDPQYIKDKDNFLSKFSSSILRERFKKLAGIKKRK